jgi:hypothetical protein
MSSMIPRATIATSAAVVLATLVACGKPARTQSRSDEVASSERAVRSVAPTGTSGTVDQRRADLLNRIRAADPQKATIERALLNEKNELGLIVNRQTNLDDLPKLMRTMLAEMDKTFPGQDHTVIAYTPTDPPRTLGTARLNARTRDMTYTPASPR